MTQLNKTELNQDLYDFCSKWSASRTESQIASILGVSVPLLYGMLLEHMMDKRVPPPNMKKTLSKDYAHKHMEEVSVMDRRNTDLPFSLRNTILEVAGMQSEGNRPNSLQVIKDPKRKVVILALEKECYRYANAEDFFSRVLEEHPIDLAAMPVQDESTSQETFVAEGQALAARLFPDGGAGARRRRTKMTT